MPSEHLSDWTVIGGVVILLAATGYVFGGKYLIGDMKGVASAATQTYHTARTMGPPKAAAASAARAAANATLPKPLQQALHSAKIEGVTDIHVEPAATVLGKAEEADAAARALSSVLQKRTGNTAGTGRTDPPLS
jgi:hypothetical protein